MDVHIDYLARRLRRAVLDNLRRRSVVGVPRLVVFHRAGADAAVHGEGGTYVGAHTTAAEGHGITRGTASCRYRKARVVDGSRQSMDAHIDYLARRLRRGVVDNLRRRSVVGVARLVVLHRAGARAAGHGEGGA